MFYNMTYRIVFIISNFIRIYIYIRHLKIFFYIHLGAVENIVSRNDIVIFSYWT